MFAKMAGHDPRIGVKAAPGGETHNEANGFTLIEVLSQGWGKDKYG